VINKIAAGEVIERPASVVKELLENAIDAAATRVDVAVEQGGLELIRVVDNGCGIAPEQLALAVTAHATSKIETADDLFRVGTLGFRGEALASIAEVSRTTLRSRQLAAESGAELQVIGGEHQTLSPCGAPPGTAVEVRNLFFNIPVRRKFLRSTQTEMGHISEMVTRAALACPKIHFTLRHNDKLTYDLPPTERWSERIGTFFGAELADDLLWVESRDNDIWLRGYAAKPSQTRGNNRWQYLFLNGRAIRDRSLQHALGEAYRGLIMTGRYPVAFLHLEMPPEMVDVNVHPTKMEVRFQDGGRLYSQLLGTLRAKFLSSDLTARLSPHAAHGVAAQPHLTVGAAAAQPARGGAADQAPWERDSAREATREAALAFSSSGATFHPALANDDVAGAHDPERAARLRAELVAWAKGQLMTEQQALAAHGEASFSVAHSDNGAATALGTIDIDGEELPHYGHAPLELLPFQRPPGRPPMLPNYPGGGAGIAPHGGQANDSRGTVNTSRSHSATAWNTAADSSPAIQIHNRYLVAETGEGLVVIDQHALHERILYEQIRTKVLAGAVESQQLLVPEPVDMSGHEAAAVLAQRELLMQLGIGVEPFGGSTILVTGYPAMLANFRPAEILRDVVDQLLTEGKTPERRDLLDELLHMISCKAAIKAGDRLSAAEIQALVEQRAQFQDSHHCPHGRPTMLVFTREELDKQFKRI